MCASCVAFKIMREIVPALDSHLHSAIISPDLCIRPTKPCFVSLLIKYALANPVYSSNVLSAKIKRDVSHFQYLNLERALKKHTYYLKVSKGYSCLVFSSDNKVGLRKLRCHELTELLVADLSILVLVHLFDDCFEVIRVKHVHDILECFKNAQ